MHWTDFELSVRDILQVAGLSVSHNISFNGRQTDIWCRTTNELFKPRILVECKSRQSENSTVGADEIQNFCARVITARASGSADFGWLITDRNIAPSHAQIIKSANLEGACFVLQHEDLINQFMNIKGYSAAIRELSKDLKDRYIDPAIRHKFGKLKHNNPSSLESCFESWLEDKQQRLLFIGGDYGQGKTSFCISTVARYLDLFERGARTRLPLYIRLRDVANQGFSIQALIRIGLHETFGLQYPSFEFLMALAQRGRILFLFDGLDEVSYSLRWPVVFQSLQEINKLNFPNNKVILTSRPGVFASDAHAVSALNKLTGDIYGRHFCIYSIEYFDNRRINQMLSRYDSDVVKLTISRLMDISDVDDLLRRPFTLSMIIETTMESGAGSEINISNVSQLYSTYTSRWMQRDSWRSSILSTEIDRGKEFKIGFVRELAWEMFRSAISQIDGAYIDRKVRSYFGDIQDVTELVPSFINEIRVCSFLDTKSDGLLEFSHSSFLQYFTAVYLANLPFSQLQEQLSDVVLPKAVVRFLAEMIVWNNITRMDGHYELISQSPKYALNYISISQHLNEPVSATCRLPEGALVDLVSKDVILLEIRDSLVTDLELHSAIALDLKLVNSKVTNLHIRSTPNVRLEISGSEVTEVNIAGGEKVQLAGAGGLVAGGYISFEKLDIQHDNKLRVRSVGLDGVMRQVLISGKSFEKSEQDELLVRLGYVNQRARSNEQLKNRRLDRAKKKI